jgi:hypothetical protein
MHFRSVRHILSSCLVLSLALTVPVGAQQVVVASDTDLLGVLDFATFTTTGTATFTKINTIGETMVVMGYSSADNKLYGLDKSGNFYQVDPSTGATTKIGNPIAISGTIASAAWDGANTIYVLDGAGGTSGTLQSVDLSAPLTHQTHSLGQSFTGNAVPDGFMAVNKPLASGGTITIGALDPNRTSPNDALYTVAFRTNGQAYGLNHPGGATGNTGFKKLTDGADINSTLYGFGQHPNDSSPNASHSIFVADTSGNPVANPISYYNIGGGNITASVLFQPQGGAVPESSTLALMAMMLGVGGGGLLLRRRRGNG